jgi:hypothetical protein
MGQASADGPAGADLRMPDVPERLSEHVLWAGGGPAGQVAFEDALSSQCTDAQRPVLHGDPVELSDLVDVHQYRRPRQPEVQHRHEALPAGEHLRLVALLT